MNIRSIIIFICLSITEIFSQGPPIFTDSPILLGLDGGGIRMFGKYVSIASGSSFVQPFVVPYNLTTNFQIGVVQPFVVQSQNEQESSVGFGNLIIFAKHLIFKNDGKGKTFRGLAKFKQSFSTGTVKVNSKSIVSQFDFVTGYVTTKFGVYGSVGYAFISENTEDKIFYNLAFGYPLLPQKYPPFQLNLFLELNGSHALEVNRELIFISPGIQLITSSVFLIETGIQIPIVDDTNFTNYSALLGIRYLIFVGMHLSYVSLF